MIGPCADLVRPSLWPCRVSIRTRTIKAAAKTNFLDGRRAYTLTRAPFPHSSGPDARVLLGKIDSFSLCTRRRRRARTPDERVSRTRTRLLGPAARSGRARRNDSTRVSYTRVYRGLIRRDNQERFYSFFYKTNSNIRCKIYVYFGRNGSIVIN